jgi:hypothetical protein
MNYLIDFFLKDVFSSISNFIVLSSSNGAKIFDLVT